MKPESPPRSSSKLYRDQFFWGVVLLAFAILVLLLLVAFEGDDSKPTQGEVTIPTTVTTLDDELVYLLAAVERDGWTLVHRQTYAQLAARLGRLDIVNALVAENQEVTSADIPVLWRLVEDALRRRDWSVATTQLQQILRISPQDARANYQLGLLLATVNPADAMPYFEQAVLSPEFVDRTRTIQSVLAQFSSDRTLEDWRTLGLVCMDLTEWGCAERAFSAALALDNLDWQSYLYRGYVRDQIMGDGLTDLETALALNPSGLTYYFLGLHYRMVIQNLPAALDLFATAYSLDPTNPALAAELGSTYQLASNYASAENWYSLAISLSPQDVRWQQLRAAFYADTNFQIDEVGLVAIQEAYALAPRNADILTSMGAAYYWLYDREQALNYLQLAFSIEPDNPRTHYFYAMQLVRDGNLQGALDSLAVVVQKLGPEQGFGLLASREIERLIR